ncbi:hypothetical protein H1O16_gp009 [Burkholderia phage BcepSaruman]|uniref:Uncharacterized protein n=1 Tax=Burkholderia phage BcepSaruman TaxID=2530032 RepID=A0A4D5ZG01_9CAUD|nr:hypothetical protein H1O16_gp009 [Burkholderia phage BcepSaruman]QBX06422.1 hypothetical protein BcepSaruman_009 [Burkholderia phage BcepSaruman]
MIVVKVVLCAWVGYCACAMARDIWREYMPRRPEV